MVFRHASLVFEYEHQFRPTLSDELVADLIRKVQKTIISARIIAELMGQRVTLSSGQITVVALPGISGLYGTASLLLYQVDVHERPREAFKILALLAKETKIEVHATLFPSMDDVRPKNESVIITPADTARAIAERYRNRQGVQCD